MIQPPNIQDLPVLKASREIDIRFSEVDSMSVAWHGSYMLYFEDAREEFGRQFGLDYHLIFNSGYYAPMTDIEFHYRNPIVYGQRVRIDITYCPTLSAKIVFDYEIHDVATDEIIATGHSVQVFIDRDRQLVLYNPPFYEEWKKKVGIVF